MQILKGTILISNKHYDTVNHMPNFIKVCTLAEIKPGTAHKVSVQGKDIVLINTGGKVYGIGAKCTHADGPLDEGEVDGNEIECPWHGARFDIATGKNTAPPASEPIPKYEVKIEGNDVLVRL